MPEEGSLPTTPVDRPNENPVLPLPLSPAVWETLLQVGRHQALRYRLPAEDVEDCALEFAARLAQDAAHRPRLDPAASQFRPFVYRCAANHVVNYRERLAVRHRRHVPSSRSSDDVSAAGVRPSHPTLVRLSVPEAHLLRAELRLHLTSLLAHLEPLQRRVFVAHALENEPFTVLAQDLEKSENAVRQIYRRAQKRILRTVAYSGLSYVLLIEGGLTAVLLLSQSA